MRALPNFIFMFLAQNVDVIHPPILRANRDFHSYHLFQGTPTTPICNVRLPVAISAR